MFATIQHQVEAKARRAALGLAGAMLLVIGIAFLTAAGWIALAIMADHLTAALIIGCVYVGLGLILFGVKHMQRRREITLAKQAAAARGAAPAGAGLAGMTPALISAFLDGFSAGAVSRRAPARD